MILVGTGDILKSDAQALVNPVNTVGVMGKGLALQFKEAFPVNYLYYKKACSDGYVQVGEMFTTLDSSGKLIINFPTKRHWRNKSEYQYIEDGLASLEREIFMHKIKSIAIPALGVGNGGLDWKIVKEMIVQVLSPLDCEVYLYEPHGD